MEKSPAYGLWLAALAVVLASLVAFSVMLIFKGVFKNATDVRIPCGSFEIHRCVLL
jgi:hypothetical protein